LSCPAGTTSPVQVLEARPTDGIPVGTDFAGGRALSPTRVDEI
jgi:hypothetical protein